MNKNENIINNNAKDLDIIDIDSLTEMFMKNTINIEEKINIFRKLNKTVSYNEDLKLNQINKLFYLNVLKDINSIFNSDKDIDNNKMLYFKIYLMYLYNITNSDSIYKKKLFIELFQNSETNKIFYKLIIANIADLKVQKFVLGILYNLVFNQSSNLSEMNNIQEFIGFFCIFIEKVLASYGFLDKFNSNKHEISQEEKDLNEINDWVHLIFNLIMKTHYNINLDLNIIADQNLKKHTNTTKSFFDLVTDKSIVGDFYYIIIEIIRDCVENSKSVNDEKYFLVSQKNFKSIVDLLLQNINDLNIVVNELINSKEFEKMDFYTFDKLSFNENTDNNNQNDNDYSLLYKLKSFNYCRDLNIKKILTFKEFICLVDIFSVFLVTDEYREFLFQSKIEFDFVENLYGLIKLTDFIYDDYFMRFKSLKETEKFNYDYIKLNENNIFFSFQTNVMKFLSNYAYKNEAFKAKLINDPEKFLAILNHMKIDNCNPFKKEWTILMLKSLCESNIYLF